LRNPGPFAILIVCNGLFYYVRYADKAGRTYSKYSKTLPEAGSRLAFREGKPFSFFGQSNVKLRKKCVTVRRLRETQVQKSPQIKEFKET
jgi:hypothetical protein